jgi:uncharacterized membrane protein (UPF0127 family)
MRHKLFAAAVLLALLPYPDTALAATPGCLPTGNGYLRARVGGAMDLDINWPDAQLECEGSARPDGSGIRLSFAGPVRSDGRRMRMVFGIGSVVEGQSGRSLPANVTVMFEGEQRLFTTRGDDRCVVDELEQERIGALGGPTRSYRIVGRGFCTEPANDLKGDERILLSRFDFAGRTTFDDGIEDLASFPKASLKIRSARGEHRFDVWVADTQERQAQGLMFVRDLAADRGMLFIEREPREVRMWMKNTFIPLDMLFIDARGRIVKIAEQTEPHSLATISSEQKASAVLELKGGTARALGLRVDDRVTWKSLADPAHR